MLEIIELTPINKNLTLDINELSKLFIEGNYDHIAAIFIDKLIWINQNTFFDIKQSDLDIVNKFVETFLHFFCQENFIPDGELTQTFVYLNSTISNIVAISDFNTTDNYVEILKRSKNNYYKMLTLVSARNKNQLNYDEIFKVDVAAASVWYLEYFNTQVFPSELTNKNIIRHIIACPDNLELMTRNIGVAYFVATYYSTDKDRILKGKINEMIQKYWDETFEQLKVSIHNNPDKKSIAIVSGKIDFVSAVSKTYYPFIKKLSETYDLTLINLSETPKKVDEKVFKKVINIRADNEFINLQELDNNNFMFAFFPDIGMNIESIYLSNLRIAPIQATSYGHSVSTFGSKMDYFIGGSLIEDKEKATENYSEQLLLIDGFAVSPDIPDYVVKSIKKTTDKMVINCNWGANKINYEMLSNLKKVIDYCPNVVFRFFFGWVVCNNNGLIPMMKDIISVLGQNNCEFYPNMAYNDYMQKMEEGDLSICSYPFGGFNSVIDCLLIQKPIVVLEGKLAYNRLCAELLKKCGLRSLITKNYNEFVKDIISIIQIKPLRDSYSKKIKELDLKAILMNNNEIEDFKTLVDGLIDNYEV